MEIKSATTYNEMTIESVINACDVLGFEAIINDGKLIGFGKKAEVRND